MAVAPSNRPSLSLLCQAALPARCDLGGRVTQSGTVDAEYQQMPEGPRLATGSARAPWTLLSRMNPGIHSVRAHRIPGFSTLRAV